MGGGKDRGEEGGGGKVLGWGKGRGTEGEGLVVGKQILALFSPLFVLLRLDDLTFFFLSASKTICKKKKKIKEYYVKSNKTSKIQVETKLTIKIPRNDVSLHTTCVMCKS